MALSERLLRILICPESHQPLKMAPPDLLEHLNRLIDEGALLDRGGAVVKEKVEAGLVREDGQLFYVVRGDIPIMMADAAISLAIE